MTQKSMVLWRTKFSLKTRLSAKSTKCHRKKPWIRKISTLRVFLQIRANRAYISKYFKLMRMINMEINNSTVTLWKSRLRRLVVKYSNLRNKLIKINKSQKMQIMLSSAIVSQVMLTKTLAIKSKWITLRTWDTLRPVRMSFLRMWNVAILSMKLANLLK